jgi:hypothetical protein
MPTTTLAVLAEAAKKVARNPVAKKAAVDLTAAAANRIRELLQSRHKVRELWEPAGWCILFLHDH